MSSVMKVDSITKSDGTAGVHIAGHVIQVVRSDTGDQQSTSTSYADTGLSASITPKYSSSKILVCVKGIGAHSAHENYQVCFRMVRSLPSANTIVDGQGNFPYNSNQYGQGFATVEGYRKRQPIMCDLLDSPNTTSQITYKLQITTTGGGTGYLGRWGQDGNWNVRTSLTLMEIAQ